MEWKREVQKWLQETQAKLGEKEQENKQLLVKTKDAMIEEITHLEVINLFYRIKSIFMNNIFISLYCDAYHCRYF